MEKSKTIRLLFNTLFPWGTLEQRLKQGRISTTTLAEWTIGICDALDYAHRQGVVHRDVKPGNILIDRDDVLRVADFGMAMFADSEHTLTRQGDVLGTPAYMAPEQITDVSQVTSSADVYALGVLLYQLLTGTLPFAGPMASVVRQITEDEPRRPQELDSGIPKDLQTICLKAMSKRPADRYESAREMADDLRCFLMQKPIQARPVGLMERLLKLMRRYPVASSLAIVASLFLCFILGGALQYLTVLDERNRAQAAERQKQRLLAHESASAGLLSMQRGHTRLAIQHFQEALERGYENRDEVHLRMARGELINGNYSQAAQHLDLVRGDTRGESVKLLRLEISLLTQAAISEVMSQLQELDRSQLSGSDAAYYEAISADNSREAFDSCMLALEANTYHHGARRLAIILALSLADFDEAMRLTRVSQQLFPDDPEFLLFDAIGSAATGQILTAQQRIARCDLTDQGLAQWQELLNNVAFVCQDLEAPSDRIFSDTDSRRPNGVTYDEFREMLMQFVKDFGPLLSERQWFLPPRVSQRFERFLEPIEDLAERDRAEVEIALANAHPEATLNVVIARRLVERDENDVPTVQLIQRYFENAMLAHGFVKNLESHAQHGAFAAALHLAIIGQVEVERNTGRVFELLATIDPNKCDDLDTVRVMTLFPNNQQHYESGARYVDRWIELATQQKDDASLAEALWEKAIIQEQRGEWYQLLLTCDELISRFPNREYPDGYSPQLLRATASERLNDALN